MATKPSGFLFVPVQAYPHRAGSWDHSVIEPGRRRTMDESSTFQLRGGSA